MPFNAPISNLIGAAIYSDDFQKLSLLRYQPCSKSQLASVLNSLLLQTNPTTVLISSRADPEIAELVKSLSLTLDSYQVQVRPHR